MSRLRRQLRPKTKVAFLQLLKADLVRVGLKALLDNPEGLLDPILQLEGARLGEADIDDAAPFPLM